nr:MAG TPA: PilA, PilC, PilN, PilO, PilM, pilus, ring, membrane channel [Caudoviricetes sp.]
MEEIIQYLEMLHIKELVYTIGILYIILIIIAIIFAVTFFYHLLKSQNQDHWWNN